LVPLRAAFGQDEANYGTARYPVGTDGLVWVRPEAVGALTAVGGFALAVAGDDPICAGTLWLHHSGAATGCCYAGRQYPSDTNGNVLVPAEAVRELLAHGFVPLPGPVAGDLERAKPSPDYRPVQG
jgi:hypothetical protein